MLIFRLFFLLSALIIALSAGMYLFTRQQRYLKFVWQMVRFIVVVLMVFGVLYLLERYALVAWRVLV